jgi:hypothetical protein
MRLQDKVRYAALALKYAALAQLGSSYAEGALQRIKTTEAIWREWNLYRGRTGAKRTVGCILSFLETTFGIEDFALDFDPSTTFSEVQLNSVFDTLSPKLIAAGVVNV